MSLVVPDDLILPESVRVYLPSVSLEVASDDRMYHGNDHHYLSCGASALDAMLAAKHLANLQDPGSILDFGAGAGRVTRWLRAAFPQAVIDACDLREQDMGFCERAFDVQTWIATTDISALQAPRKYDLIWLGSVVTHLSADNSRRMFDKMLSWINPRGLVIISTSGRFALERQRSGNFVYIHPAGWDEIVQGYAASGYGYADYEGQSGYGISITKPSWVAELVAEKADTRLVLFSETAWDGHLDVLAVQSIG